MPRLFAALLLILTLTAGLRAQVPPAFDKSVPESVRDLQDIEDHVQKLVAKVLPTTVSLRIGNAQGSGVLIDRHGHILTAGHVSGAAGREAIVIFSDGYRARGKTLGANNGIDSGMVVLTEQVDFIHTGMAHSADLKRGQWCLALGHPNGYKLGRVPVARLGRVQAFDGNAIVTDCALVGGDSGGPLFDMNGRVIGIHSRIGGKVSANVHVPIDTYRDTWTKLAAGEVWGNPFPFVDVLKPPEAYFGVRAAERKSTLRIESITPGSPADKAGLRANDQLLAIDNRSFTKIDEVAAFLRTKRPGNQINVQVRRGQETIVAAVTLGKRIR